HYQCRYLASRGMVAITADYRVRSRQGVKAVSCVTDAKSAIRWVREQAGELGVDPNRIVASGGSAGGHIAACTATLNDLDEPGENHSVSSRRNAMVLFNPAVIMGPAPGIEVDAMRAEQLAERVGADPESISPYHHLAAGVPPCLILIGTKDS